MAGWRSEEGFWQSVTDIDFGPIPRACATAMRLPRG